MTTRQAAAALGISNDRINQLCAAGVLKFRLSEGRRNISAASVNQYKSTRKVGWPAGRPRKVNDGINAIVDATKYM